jgi:hypothetical protein
MIEVKITKVSTPQDGEFWNGRIYHKGNLIFETSGKLIAAVMIAISNHYLILDNDRM